MKFGDKVVCVVCGRRFRMTHELTHSKYVCSPRCRRVRLSRKAGKPPRVAVPYEVEFAEMLDVEGQ